MSKVLKIFALMASFAFLANCTSNSRSAGGGSPSPSPLGGAQMTTYAWLEQNLFRRSCTDCHNSSRRSGNIDFSSFSSWTSATSQTGQRLLTPRLSGQSAVYTAVAQRRMPPPTSGSSQSPDFSTYEVLRQWIDFQNADPNALYSQVSSSNGNGNPSPFPNGGATVASYSEVNRAVFSVSCVSCHNPSQLGGGLDLSTYNSVKQAGVIPFNPAGSRVFTAIQLGRMPKNGIPLSSDRVKLVQDWIQQGANP